ncbi:MAG TPA: glycosyltransferase [Gaiellaceae bacterium]
MSDHADLAASIVVLTLDRPQLLAETLDSLAALDFPSERYEIVVIDDGPVPKVPPRAGVRVVAHGSHRGINAARNTGMREARSELVCFVDDDIDAPSGWLREVVEAAARHPDAWVIGGPVRLRFEGRQVSSCRYCISWEGSWDLGPDEGPSASNAIGCNMAVRKSAVAAAGPFDEELPPYGEELEWQDRARRMGAVVVNAPDAWLWHRRTSERVRFHNRLGRYYRIGRGHAFSRRSQGLPVEPHPERIPRWLAHAAKHRCSGGVAMVALEVGKLGGIAELAWNRRRSAPVTSPDG